MTSRNWPGKFALVCATSVLFAQAQEPAKKAAPAVALADAADAAQWQPLVKDIGWQLIFAPADPDANVDKRVQALAIEVDKAVKAGDVDPARVFAVGRGPAAATVFYAISRMPDRWTAGVAIGGSPKAAIDSNRIFAVNFTNTPVLWASDGPNDEAVAQNLKQAGINLEWRSAKALSNRQLFDWMDAHLHAEHPLKVDCETNSPTFANCYWVQPTKFDAAERNDVLPSTLVPGDTAASLDLGGFGYHANDAGPGVMVAFLPERYKGPLKVGDRLAALNGKPIENARHLQVLLEKATSTSDAVVMVERGKDRIRVETRIVVPKREAVPTARVKAEYMAEDHQVLLISRSIIEMKVTIPAEWVPANLVWNGLTIDKIQAAGCVALKIEKELLHAGTCE